jgi:hypothetical protein
LSDDKAVIDIAKVGAEMYFSVSVSISNQGADGLRELV